MIEARIGDFDIDCVLDEETQVNIMPKRTWEACYDPFIRRHRNIQREDSKFMWEACSDIYDCQWNFDKGIFLDYQMH